MSGLRGDDAREPVARIRLCFSANFDDSPWLSCHALNSDRGIIDKTHLIAHKDMRQLPSFANDSLGPAEQVGPKGWRQILQRTMRGRSDEQPASKRKIVLVDLNPGVADVLDAAWQMQLHSYKDASETPLVVAIAFYNATSEVERSKFNGMLGYLRGLVLRTWWEDSEEAAPAQNLRPR